jgi:hypothetical protein
MLPTVCTPPSRPFLKRFDPFKPARKSQNTGKSGPYQTDALLPYASFHAQRAPKIAKPASAPSMTWRQAAMRPLSVGAIALGMVASAVLLSLMVGLKMATSGVGAGMAIVLGTVYGVTALLTHLPALFRTRDGGAYAQGVVLSIMRGVARAFGFARIPLEGFAGLLARAFS